MLFNKDFTKNGFLIYGNRWIVVMSFQYVHQFYHIFVQRWDYLILPDNMIFFTFSFKTFPMVFLGREREKTTCLGIL